MAKVIGASDFFNAIFGDWCDEQHLIVIWSLPGKAAQFFSTTAAATDYAMNLAESQDVYFGVGLYRPGIKHGRGKAGDVIAIPVLWADVDYGTHGGGKKLPPTEADAKRVLDHLGVKPSILVHSGGGFHAYWILKEPLTTEENAAAVARVWQNTIAACAKYYGYDMDATHDLSRVLRVPATINHKKKSRLPVEVRRFTAARYDTSDLEPYYVCEALNPTKSDTIPVDAIAIDPAAKPPTDLMTASLTHNTTFRRTWEQRRGPDLHDHSASGYELSLASQAIGMGWTDQQIADLIIDFRRKHHHDAAKGCRRDYLQNTIAKAKQERESDVAVNEVASICNRGDRDRDGIIAGLRRALRLPIKRWQQLGTDNPIYSLTLEDGTDITVGTSEQVVNQRSFRKRLWEVTGDVPPQIKQRQWDHVLRGLGVIREVRENPERTPAGFGEDLLTDYTRRRAIRAEDEWEGAINDQDPFYRRHLGVLYLYVNMPHLRRFCEIDRGEKITKQELTNVLRVMGFEEQQIRGRKRDSMVRRYWRREALKTKTDLLNGVSEVDK
jgi:hypothetical protein